MNASGSPDMRQRREEESVTPERRAAYERADELAKRIRTACEAAGLKTRPGAFWEQLR